MANVASSYQIIFQLMSTGSTNGYVALDDITITVGRCKGNVNIKITVVKVIVVSQ